MSALLLLALLGDDPALRSGTEWLLQMQQPSGKFQYGWRSAQHQPLPGDQSLRQAGAALALARAGRELGAANCTAAAERALRTLLAERPTTPPAVANPTGFAALLLIALAELEAPTAELVAARAELAGFLLRRQRADGSFHVGASREDPGDDPPANVPYYAPQALLAIAKQHAKARRPELLAAARKGVACYRRWWEDHPHEAFPPWMIPALTAVHAETRDAATAAFAFELAEWCHDLQHGEEAPAAWRGGFGVFHEGRRIANPPGITTASFCEALGAAVELAAARGERSRAERYGAALGRGAAFLRTMQFTPERLEHFAPAARPRLAGGFWASLDDGNLRIDQNQHAICALLTVRMAAGRPAGTMAVHKD